MDITTFICFGNSVDAIHAPDFKAPILVAMASVIHRSPFNHVLMLHQDASLPVFVRFKHFETYKNMIMNCPPGLSRIISPATAGLVDLQEVSITNNVA
jgi:hypothetical protein